MNTDLRSQLKALSSDQRAQLMKRLADKRQAEAFKARTTFPLSDMQRIMWTAQALAPSSSAYNVGFALRLDTPFHSEAIRSALQTIVDRHPALRTVYSTVDGRVFQTIRPTAKAPFEDIDATEMSGDELERTMRQLYLRPFDLANGPILRLSQLRRPDGDAIILIAAHHLAVDLWSIDLLIEDLRIAYAAHLAGETPQFPPSGKAYCHFVDEQDAMAESAEGQRLWAYWKKQLRGAPPILDVPGDHPRPSLQRLTGETYSFNFSSALTKRINQFAQTEKKTVYTVLLAAWQILLHKLTGSEDMVVASPVSSRPQAYTRTVGCMINSIIIRGRPQGALTFRDFADQVQNAVFGALEHPQFPLGLLTHRLNLPRDLSRPVLAQVGFSLESPRLHSRGSTALSPAAHVLPFLAQQEGQYELYLEMAELEGSLQGALRYSTDIFKMTSAVNMVRWFEGLLEDVVNQPQDRIKELGRAVNQHLQTNAERPVPLMPADEQKRIQLGQSEAFRALWKFHRQHSREQRAAAGHR
ncbi:MAG: condensation domain-containing protein [Myxococcota bacterium]